MLDAFFNFEIGHLEKLCFQNPNSDIQQFGARRSGCVFEFGHLDKSYFQTRIQTFNKLQLKCRMRFLILKLGI